VQGHSAGSVVPTRTIEILSMKCNNRESDANGEWRDTVKIGVLLARNCQGGVGLEGVLVVQYGVLQSLGTTLNKRLATAGLVPEDSVRNVPEMRLSLWDEK